MIAHSKKKVQPIRAYARIKPLHANEESMLKYDQKKLISTKSDEEFQFDKVFSEKATNQQIFEQIGKPLINHSLDGYNGCVLAYGQTSSGKTYTMKGQQNQKGLIPLTLQHLFFEMDKNKICGVVKINYLEIYNENILDLLSNNETSLDVRQDFKKNVTVINLTEEKVSSVEEAMKIFQKGQLKRKYASNSLNLASSRSHTIFRINIEIVTEQVIQLSSQLNMVDLAGSQGVSKTKAEGTTKKEGENINKSILALSNVIRGMSQKQSYINFRDSKLTRLLQSSLCSNSKSFVICTVNPTLGNIQETINTLKFGNDAAQIKLSIKQNAYTKQGTKITRSETTEDNSLKPQERVQLQQLRRSAASLKEQLTKHQRFEAINQENIMNLQLDNHSLQKSLQLANIEIKQLKEKYSDKSLLQQSKEFYERQIQEKNQILRETADRYEDLNEYAEKLERNERYLVDRNAKYQSELHHLKQILEDQKPKTPKKKQFIQFKEKQNQESDFCPLTIGTIVILKKQIIQLKIQLCEANEEITRLLDKEDEHQEQIMSVTGLVTPKNMQKKVKMMKRQLLNAKMKQKKLRKMVKDLARKGVEQYQEFNRFMFNKQEQSDRKKNEFQQKCIDNV